MEGSDTPKAAFIRAYFDEEERKVARLNQLASAGYVDEAFVLCLVYVDRAAQKLSWPSMKTGRNFVRALADFGQDQEVGLVHPKHLASELRRLKPIWHPVADAVDGHSPGPSYELFSPTDLEVALAPVLTEEQRQMLHDELWRGTIAAIAYTWLRNPAVHGIGATTRLTFSGTTFAGHQVRALDFARLASALRHIVAEARRRSEASNQWYGDDRVLV